MTDQEKVQAALDMVRAVRGWCCAAYQWEAFWADMGWRPESMFEENAVKLRDFIAQAEEIFPELKTENEAP